jgi:hypothetical protein
MNGRIKELEKQCHERVYADMCDDYDVVFDKKKFAELIVQECADLVDRAISDGGIDGRVVKEHFGVEE